MVIKNKGQRVVALESSSSTVSINLNECIEVSFDDNSISFLRPGEYEHQGIDIISREVQTEGYKACANISRITVEGVRVLFLLNSVEAKQDDLNQILDIDILVITEDELDKLDRLTMLYNPQRVIILQTSLKEDIIIETVKKSFSTANISTERQVKTKRDEYSSENFVVSFVVLKK